MVPPLPGGLHPINLMDTTSKGIYEIGRRRSQSRDIYRLTLAGAIQVNWFFHPVSFRLRLGANDLAKFS